MPISEAELIEIDKRALRLLVVKVKKQDEDDYDWDTDLLAAASTDMQRLVDLIRRHNAQV